MKTFSRWIVACLAALAFLAPLKFGTPVVTQAHLIPPANFFEWVFFSWPNQIAVIFAFAALLWLVLDSERLAARVDALFLLPVVFLATQVLATPTSINRQLSVDTLMHFATCVLLFYAAAWYVRDGAAAARIFGGLGLATFLVVVSCSATAFRRVAGHTRLCGALRRSSRDAARLASADDKQPGFCVVRRLSKRIGGVFGGGVCAHAGVDLGARQKLGCPSQMAHVGFRGRIDGLLPAAYGITWRVRGVCSDDLCGFALLHPERGAPRYRHRLCTPCFREHVLGRSTGAD